MGEINKTDKNFKILINKRFTADVDDPSTGRAFYQEKGADTLNIHAREIWTNPVPTDPNQAITDGIAIKYDQFILTPDELVGVDNNVQQSWFFQSGSSFTPGTSEFNDDFTLTDFIGDKYGTDYEVKLFDNEGNQIFKTDPINWIFDYKVGVLHVANPSAGTSYAKPYKVTVYRYIGATLNSSVDSNGAIDTNFPGSGIISSSTQISQDISGSWKGFISGSGIISSSTQIASDISGSFLGYLSGSGILSSSTQISQDISGSWKGFISGSGIISSSTQIASDISGSFLGYLSGSGILSSSTQISQDISGSFLGYLSGSGILSSSTQISQDISGSFLGYLSGSGIVSSSGQLSSDFLSSTAFTADGISGSWQGFISGSGIISSSTQISQDISGSFLGYLSGSGIVSSSTQIEQDISGSFLGYLSGSGIYSSSLQTLGNITSSGNISSSGNIIIDNITTSGHISASGSITASGLFISGDTHISGNLDLDGAFDHEGFTFVEDNITILTGSNSFGQTASFNQHTFTGSVKISSSQTDVFTVVSGSDDKGDPIPIFNINKHGNITVHGTFIGGGILSSSTNTLDDFLTSSPFTPGGISGSWQGFISGSGILSSSTQIASDISGSFLGYLSGSGILSSSTQIASDISGSFLGYLSGSGILSSSTQIAQDISGSFLGYLSGSGILSSSTQISQDISGSFLGYLSGSGILSSSTQIASDISGSWKGFISGSGIVSSSTQIASDISGSWKGFISGSGIVSSSDQIVDIGLVGSGVISSSEQFTNTDDVEFRNLTASIISSSGNLFASLSLQDSSPELRTVLYDSSSGQFYYTGSYGGSSGGGGDATVIELGASTTGNNNFSSATTVQSAINDIDTILGLLAPAKPPNLEGLSLDWYPNENNVYRAKKPDGNLFYHITNDPSPQFDVNNFYNGDSGVLTAQLDDNDDGTFTTEGTITLTTDDDSGNNSALQIVNDEDPYAGQTGKSGFYKRLDARINLSGLTANSVGDYTRHKVKLSHSETGDTIAKGFNIDSDPSTSVTNLNYTYIETDNFHYQSGIKYLGNGDIIKTHYDVTIDSNANFINEDGKIAEVSDSPNSLYNKDKSVTTWTPGTTYNVTHSSDVYDGAFIFGENVTLEGRNFKASGTSYSSVGSTKIIPKLLVDATQEDETKPDGGANLPLRVKSGKGQYPSFGTGTGQFGGTFNSATSLTATDEYELQFATGYFHWPASTNYEDYTPSGPNYSSISGDNTSGFTGRRYATFKIGSITTAGSVTLNIPSTYGFDNATIQTTDGFILQVMIVNDSNESITGWIDGNSGYTGAGNTIEGNGTGGVNPTGNVSGDSTESNFTRIITFGAVDGGLTGNVYVRIGWNVSGGTDPTITNGTVRKIKNILLG